MKISRKNYNLYARYALHLHESGMHQQSLVSNLDLARFSTKIGDLDVAERAYLRLIDDAEILGRDDDMGKYESELDKNVYVRWGRLGEVPKGIYHKCEGIRKVINKIAYLHNKFRYLDFKRSDSISEFYTLASKYDLVEFKDIRGLRLLSQDIIELSLLSQNIRGLRLLSQDIETVIQPDGDIVTKMPTHITPSTQSQIAKVNIVKFVAVKWSTSLKKYVKDATFALVNEDMDKAEKRRLEYITEDEVLQSEIENMTEHLIKLVTDLTTITQDVHIYAIPVE
jgi:hypothetical protein